MTRRYQWLDDIVMGTLAAVAVWLAFQPDARWVHDASVAIWVVFVAEYAVRLVLARGRRLAFLRANLPDLVAIVPWDVLRGARLLRLLRLLRMLRGLEVLWRVSATARGILRTNHLRYVMLMTIAFIVAGGLAIRHAEPGIGSIEDGIWWSLVTTTTVGYGDIAPRTSLGRLIAAVLMIAGIGAIGMITGSIATYFLGLRGARNPHVRQVQEQLGRWDALSHRERHELGRVLAALAESAEGYDGPVRGARAADAAPPSSHSAAT
ncbi:MAG: ion transporter [Candidatus Eisenbacteria bacterium]|nr:ion transporter [Candidatus Eisenbacteria bacterium]